MCENLFKKYWLSSKTIKFVKEIKSIEGFYNPNLLKHLAGEAFKEQYYRYKLTKYWSYCPVVYGRLALEAWKLELEIPVIQQEDFEAFNERAKACYRKLIRSKNFKYF